MRGPPHYNVILSDISIMAAAPTDMRLRNVDHLTCNNVVISPLSQASPNFGYTFDNEGGLTNISGCDVSPIPPTAPPS